MERAGEQADARRAVQDAGDVGEAAELVGRVVHRVEVVGRVLDADVVVQVLAREIIVDRTGPSAVFETRLQGAARPAVHREGAAGVGGAGLGGDIDDAGLAEAVLGGQGAGDQRQRMGEPRFQRLAEHGQALRQLHAVQAVLRVAVLVADMHLAEAVLRDAGRLQQDLLQGRLVALGQGLDGAAVEAVHGGAEAGLDGGARGVQPLRDHGDVVQGHVASQVNGGRRRLVRNGPRRRGRRGRGRRRIGRQGGKAGKRPDGAAQHDGLTFSHPNTPLPLLTEPGI